MEQTRFCPSCNDFKPSSEFDKSKDGRCKPCRAKYNRQHLKTHKGKATKVLVDTRRNKRRAEKELGRQIKDTLTWQQVAFVLSTGECVYCRKELDYFDSTVDHVLTMKSGKGENTYENLVCSCKGCNSSKNARPILEYLRSLENPLQLRRVIDRLAQRRGIGYFEMWEQLKDEVEQQQVVSTA